MKRWKHTLLNKLSVLSGKKDEREFDDKPIIYRINCSDIESVPTVKNTKSYYDIPNKLFISPGIYRIKDMYFRCDKPGLYRFVFPQKKNIQRIVVNDKYDAVRHLMGIFLRGNSDDHLSFEILYQQSLKRRLILTCGPTSRFVKRLLSDLNIKVRIVHTLALGEWNSYNNGHTMLETFDENINKWILVDYNKHCFYRVEGAKYYANLFELWDAIMNEKEICIERGYMGTQLDASGFKDCNSNFDYHLIEEMFDFNNEQRITVLKKFLHVPMIETENKDIFFILKDKSKRRRVERYSESYKYMTQEDFLHIFYKMV